MGVDRSIPGVDLYLEFDVGPEATTDEIEAAYRALMKRHHPDHAGPEGLARSKRLNLARDWLVDPERRARYDASRRALRVDARRSSPRPAAQAQTPRSGRPPLERRRRPGTAMAHASRIGRWWPMGTLARLALVGVVAVVASSLVFSLGSSASNGPGTGSPGALGDPSSAPTAEPTPAATLTATPEPTAPRTPASTPTPSAAPTGRADIRFSGMYTEHFVQRLGGTSGCTTTTGHGGSVTLTGFAIGSGPGSGSKWQLTLADLTAAWSMDIFFEDTADGLWWNSGVGIGFVTRTADGFTFDVVMTDSAQSLRAKGTVTCR